MAEPDPTVPALQPLTNPFAKYLKDALPPGAPEPSVNPFSKYHGIEPSVQEDIVKGAGPELGRCLVELWTSIPTIADLAGDAAVWGAEKAGLSPEKLEAVKGAQSKVKEYLTPLSYGPMMEAIQYEGTLKRTVVDSGRSNRKW